MLQRHLSHLNGRKIKPLIISVSGLTLPYVANVVILMDLYDLCLLSAQFCYIILYIQKVESSVQIANQCAPLTISNGAKNLVLQVLQF
jgi:hypothetical protein